MFISKKKWQDWVTIHFNVIFNKRSADTIIEDHHTEKLTDIE